MARLELEADLRLALERQEFEVHYQPLVELEDGRIAEVEALVRWRHPRRGLVGPGEFIPLAEETGLIVPLGRWVLETACRQVRAWQQALGAESLALSVNLSARQLAHPGLADEVRAILDDTRLEPDRLKLEITESIAVADTCANRETLWALRRLGVRLAIDDFGTGSSALNYLRRFPVDTLKIDRSFVEELGQDMRTTAMVGGIVAFAKSLGLHVTGEGVETAEQSHYLRSMGCDQGQGYLFARPIAAPELEALLRAQPGMAEALLRAQPGPDEASLRRAA
jgi:EAL domain-containing protein (putative c-di-GMP-specific phosphodiesterase class I)